MKRDAVVVAALVGVIASTSVRADEPGSPGSNCDQCEDLCQLMFAYAEREALIEMYREYAHSNENRTELEWEANPVAMVEKKLKEDWAPKRQLPCAPRPPPGGGGGGDVQTDMWVDTTNPKCNIVSGDGTPLTPAAEQEFHRAKNCRPASDAVIAHEKVHQQHCLTAYSGTDPALAARILGTPANMAESELQAHIKHRDLLADQIRKIVSEKNCGWNPTEGQQYSGALPSQAQIQKMEQRGWQAVQSLAGGQ